jgi:tRNA threonylcarbamoyladenosine biosynthesis protein TsaE
MLLERIAATAEDMERLGAVLAPQLRPGVVVFLHGELGAGKTTFIRGVLRGLGFTGAVKSPTYTLVEPYQLGGLTVYHFDLYRLNDPEELEFLGVRDYLEGSGVCLVEWAERGAGVLPAPDVDIAIERQEERRVVRLTSNTENGAVSLRGLA